VRNATLVEQLKLYVCKNGFMSYLYIGCGFLISFIIALIAGKKGKALPDYILIVWLSIFLANIVTLFLLARTGYSAGSFGERILFEFSEASIFLHGPFFWFYTLALTQPKFVFRKKYLLHLVPFFLSFLILVWGVIYEGSVNFSVRKELIILKMLSLLIYCIAIILQLRRHRQSIQNIFSNTEEKQLNWLYFLCWGILIIWAIASISLLAGVFTNITTPEYISRFPNLAICIFIYLMGYFGVRQNSIFVKHELENYSIGDKEEKVIHKEDEVYQHEEKYKKSGLNKVKADRLWQDLLKYMESEQPYLDPELSLFSLAEMMHVLPNHLSRAINEKESQNFFDYINGYRINAVKAQIVAGKHKEHTLLGIAFNCGFNSKASFNRAFKKYTGLTPTDFKKQIEQ
jgi:AraC-like DNA-binding protein